MYILVIVIALVGGTYYYLQDRKEARRSSGKSQK